MRELHYEPSARFEKPRGIGDKPPVNLKSIRAAVESDGRFMLAHFALQRRRIGFRNVGWIRNHQIERSGQQRASEIALHEVNATTEFLVILARNAQCGARDV